MRRSARTKGLIARARWGVICAALGILAFAPCAQGEVTRYPGETFTGRVTVTVHNAWHSVHGGDGSEDTQWTATFTLQLQPFYDGREAIYSGTAQASWSDQGYSPNDVNIDRNCKWQGSGTAKATAEIHYVMNGSDRGNYTVFFGADDYELGLVAPCTLPPDNVVSVDLPASTEAGRAVQPQLKGFREDVRGTSPYARVTDYGWNFVGSFRDGWKTDEMRAKARRVANIADHMMDWSGAAGAIVGVPAAFIPGGQVVTAAFAGAAAGSLIGREFFEWVADDPPDPNYRVIAQPAKPRATSVRAGRGVSAAQAKALSALTRTQAELSSYLDAFKTSYERASGVDWTAADATRWWTAQETAAASYANAAAARFAKLAGLRGKLASALGPAAKMRLKSSMYTRARDRVRRAGLPAAFTAALTKLGLSPPQIRELRASVAAMSVRRVPASFGALLRDPTLAAWEKWCAEALRRFPDSADF